jgi:mannitol-specific phosphotransferase system IIBC component
VDHFEPTVDDLERAIDFIQQINQTVVTTTTTPTKKQEMTNRDDDDDDDDRNSSSNDDSNNSNYMQYRKNHKNHHQQAKVYIHCRAGHGRSAAVVMAYLISKDPMNVNLKELNDHLLSLRNVRKTLWQQPNIQRLAQRLKEQHQRQKQEDQTIDMIVSDWDRYTLEEDKT